MELSLGVSVNDPRRLDHCVQRGEGPADVRVQLVNISSQRFEAIRGHFDLAFVLPLRDGLIDIDRRYVGRSVGGWVGVARTTHQSCHC